MPAATPTRPLSRSHVRLAVFVLLALHFVMAVSSKFRSSLTYDEPLHLAAGLHYWAFNDYRFHQENGIMPQRWAALPAYIVGARPPPPHDGPAWSQAKRWAYSDEVLFKTPGQDHFPLLMAGRAMIALFSVGTGLLIYLWAKSLFGLRGGFIALSLFTFSPEFLGHGALVTSDVPMTFCMLAAVTLWWRHLHRPGWFWAFVSAVFFGLACLAKFSAVLLLPMFFLMSVARLAYGPIDDRRMTTALRIVRTFLGHVLVAAALIWAAYGFRYEMNHPDLPRASQPFIPWADLLPELGPVQGAAVQAARAHRLLPEAYLYGYTYTVDSAKGRSSFLNMAIADRGWSSFFPRAFFYKTTIALLAAVWLVATFGVGRLRKDPLSPRRYVLAPLLILFAIYGAFALTSNLNIGHRHLLPLYPVLFIITGALRVLWAEAAYFGRALVLLVVGTQAVESIKVFPHHLAFFNHFAGGQVEADTHLVDSSLDWGQGLPDLSRWLKEHRLPGEPLTLGYFGKSDPGYYGIDATFTDPVPELLLRDGRARMGPYRPGLFAISATALRQPYSIGRGPWDSAKEDAYRALQPRADELHRLMGDTLLPARLSGPAGSALLNSLTAYDALRANRLYHYLSNREPLARLAGGSIRVYRLSEAEVLEATQGQPSPEWAKAPLVRADRGL